MNLGSSSRPEGSKQSGERLHHRLTLDCDICTTIDNVQGARGNDQLSRSSILSRSIMHLSHLQLEQCNVARLLAAVVCDISLSVTLHMQPDNFALFGQVYALSLVRIR